VHTRQGESKSRGKRKPNSTERKKHLKHKTPQRELKNKKARQPTQGLNCKSVCFRTRQDLTCTVDCLIAHRQNSQVNSYSQKMQKKRCSGANKWQKAQGPKEQSRKKQGKLHKV